MKVGFIAGWLHQTALVDQLELDCYFLHYIPVRSTAIVWLMVPL